MTNDKHPNDESTRLRYAASEALTRAITAIGQVGLTEVESKKTVRTERSDPELGKVTTTEEERSVRLVESGIDVSALKQITATLKDIKEVLGDGGDEGTETGVVFLPRVGEGALSSMQNAKCKVQNSG